MAIPNPNPNIADGIKSDNKTYSSNKIESLITMATELPIPGAGDAGKVLTVNSDHDGYELDTPVAPTSIIDDTASSESTVYSSDKVDTLLGGKADTNDIIYMAHKVSVDGSTISAPIGYHSQIFFSRFEYLFVKTSATTGTLYEIHTGEPLLTVNGTGTFGILDFTLSEGVLTIATNNNSTAMFTIIY